MIDPVAAAQSARSYLRNHPEELTRVMRNAVGLRFGVPVVALRWLGSQLERSGAVEDMQIDSAPPGLRVGASVSLMKTPIRAAATVFIERVVFNAEELTVSLRMEDVSLKLNGEAETPVAALIQSGALDLSNPGTLAGYLPGRSPVIAEARGNRIVLDLMRDPKIGNNPLVRKAVGVMTSLVTLHGIETDPDHVDVSLRALPGGISGAARAFKRHIISPSIGRLLK